MYTLIREAARNDPHKQCIQLNSGKPPTACGLEAFELGVRDLRTFIASRAAFIRNALSEERYQPAGGGPAIQSVRAGYQGTGVEVAPGSIVAIRGSDFGAEMVPGGAFLPRSAGTTFIAVEGVRAPILSISATEAVIQIPWDIPLGTASIAVAGRGAFSNTLAAPVVAETPEIVALAHTDGAPLDGDRPARPGEIVTVYATGMGPVNGTVISGNPAPWLTLIRTANEPALLVGAEPAQVLFCGLAPGSVGMYQINFIVPGNLPPDPVALSISMEGRTSSLPLPIAKE
jgi:uncharacterized protein (TIGR03437 family)